MFWLDYREMWASGAWGNTWEVRKVDELPEDGSRPVDKTVAVNGETTITVDLERATGRIVRTKIDAHHYRVAARRKGDAKWRLILWQDARFVPTHTEIPGAFTAFLAPGRWEFRVSSNKHAMLFTDPIAIVADDRPLDLAFDLKGGAAIHGRVLAPNGKGVPNVIVYLFREDGGALRRLDTKEIATDENGAYKIEGLGPGRIRLALTRHGAPALADFTIGAADREVILRLGG